MFSGIVEEYAEVVRLEKEQTNLHLTLKCSFVDELKIDQSIAHNGVCLTVVSIQDGTYTCLLYTSPSPRDRTRSRMPSSA